VDPRSCAGELFTEIYIPFHLMDGVVEESIELIGAAGSPQRQEEPEQLTKPHRHSNSNQQQ